MLRGSVVGVGDEAFCILLFLNVYLMTHFHSSQCSTTGKQMLWDVLSCLWHIKDPLLLTGKSISANSGIRFPLSLSRYQSGS